MIKLKKYILPVFILVFNMTGCVPCTPCNNIADKSINNIQPSLLLTAPEVAQNGLIVPIRIAIKPALAQGDKLVINGDNEKALTVQTDKHPITEIRTRLRLMQGKVTATVYRQDGKEELNESVQIKITQPAKILNVVDEKLGEILIKKRVKDYQIKMLLRNQMLHNNHIKTILVATGEGGIITLKITPRISKNPYFSITSTDKFDAISIVAMRE